MKIDDKTHKVAVVLPYIDNKVLLQLRDFKSGIIFPGNWGFFGGAVEDGEDPQEAARRELLEEIGFNVEVLCELGAEQYPLLENTFLYSFFCALKMPIEKIVLGEGFDFGLFTLEEIVTGKLYSEKAKKFSPVIPSNYIAEKVSILFNRIKNG